MTQAIAETETVPRTGKFLLSGQDILGVALEHFSLPLSERARTPLDEIPITPELLAAFAREGFECEGLQETALSISDPADTKIGSTRWVFDAKNSKKFFVRAVFKVDDHLRSVSIEPKFTGGRQNALFPASNFRACRAFVACYPETRLIFRKIAEANGPLLVSWETLFPEGILPLREIFEEFSLGNEARRALSVSAFSPFNPSPRLDSYVLPAYKAKMLDAWGAQLEAFKEEL